MKKFNFKSYKGMFDREKKSFSLNLEACSIQYIIIIFQIH